MESVKISKTEIETYDMLMDYLSGNRPVCFTRWGDGEWQCMAGYNGDNCDGHIYFNTLTGALLNVMQCPYLPNNFMFGLQPKAVSDEFSGMTEASRHRHFPGRTWYNADAFHDASIRGMFMPDIKKLSFKVIMVGNKHLCNWIGQPSIEVPEYNCWLQYERTKAQCVDYALKGATHFMFSCSLMTNVLIYELHLMFPNITLLNMGSVWEPYVGRNIRRYHGQIIERLQK